MNFEQLKKQMAHHAPLIKSLIIDIDAEQARWKPTPDTWSILEVINHLYDEEREDFRAHLDLILHHPEQPWPNIHPFAWVTERQYNTRELDRSLQAFLSERQNSLDWLTTLSNPNWEATIAAPFGEIRAGDIFASWVVHDQWHIQQLIQLLRAYTISNFTTPYDVRYAGEL